MRNHQEGAQEATNGTQGHPGGSWEILVPGSTQEALRVTQEARRRDPQAPRSTQEAPKEVRGL